LSRGGIRDKPVQNFGTTSRAALTSSMRHHTSDIVASVMSLPRIAVKPHSTTQK
jgi:hypothetical protein